MGKDLNSSKEAWERAWEMKHYLLVGGPRKEGNKRALKKSRSGTWTGSKESVSSPHHPGFRICHIHCWPVLISWKSFLSMSKTLISLVLLFANIADLGLYSSFSYWCYLKLSTKISRHRLLPYSLRQCFHLPDFHHHPVTISLHDCVLSRFLEPQKLKNATTTPLPTLRSSFHSASHCLKICWAGSIPWVYFMQSPLWMGTLQKMNMGLQEAKRLRSN